MARKQYDEEFRVRAMLRAEELGNVSAAAREVGVAESTLRTWRAEKPGESAEIREQVKASMLERLEEGAMKFYQAVIGALEEQRYSPGQLLTGFGIVFDKYAKLREMQGDDGDDGQLSEFVKAMREAYERDRSAES